MSAGRKPVTAEYRGGKGPRQRAWEAIRALKGKEWSIIQIAATCDIDERTISSYCNALEKAGIVEVVRTEPARCRIIKRFFSLVKDEGIDAPRVKKDGSRVTQGLAQEQMWRALRMLKGDVNWRELAAMASSTRAPVAPAAAADYLAMLNRAGYLVLVHEGKPGTQARYRLSPSRNTGPRPPMICRTKVVYDPNEDKIVWQPEITEEDAIYGK